MKLLLFISHSGTLSRRKTFEAISEGVVTVNGIKVKEPSAEINPDKDTVLVQGRPVNGKRFEYILLNKPTGYVTTCEGQFRQRTVMDLLPKELAHVRPVGRLDKETEGLLVLTNDGDLAHRLMHPAFDVSKTYFARVRWYFTPQSAEKLEQGVILFGEKTAPARVETLGVGDKESEIKITIHEGKKRQVRLMLDAVGNPVVYLKRLRQGPLDLGALVTGAWRRLSEDEVTALRHIKPPSRFPEPVKRARSFGREEGRSPKPSRDRVMTRDDRSSGMGRPSYREERAPREGSERFSGSGDRRDFHPRAEAPRERSERSPSSEGKPAFSSHSDKRRYSSTREWHSPSNPHRPAERPLVKPSFSPRSNAPRERSSGSGERREFRPRTDAPRERSSGSGERREFRPRTDAPRERSSGSGERREFSPRTDARRERPYSGGRSPFGKPSSGRSSSGRPSSGRPSSGRPSFGKPASSRPSSGKPAFGKPSSGRPSFGKPAFGKPSSGKPSFGRKTFNKKPYNKSSH